MATLSFESASFSNDYDSVTHTSVINEPIPSLVSATFDNFDLLKVQKLFKNLSESQQKFFISNLISTFSPIFLRNLNLTLESLSHNDFDYKINVNRERPVLGNIISRSSNYTNTAQTPRRNSILTDKSFPKLPSIVEKESTVKQSSNKVSRENETIAKYSNKESRESENETAAKQNLNKVSRESEKRSKLNIIIDSNTSTVMETSRSQLRARKHVPYDIGRFALTKSLDVIEMPWNLNQVTSRYFSENKLQENTDNLVQKLKALFQEKYIKSKDSAMFVNLNREKENKLAVVSKTANASQMATGGDPTFKEDSIFSNSKKNIQQSSFTIQEDEVSELSNQQLHSRDSQRESESRGRSRNKNRRHGGSTSLDQRKNSLLKINQEDLKNVYMKKLHNNYYDRKLWNTLVSSNKLDTNYNFYMDGISRDYNDEFSILTQSDWTDSTFAQKLSRYSDKMADMIREKKGNEYDIDTSTTKHSATTNSTRQTNWTRELNKSELTTYQKSIHKVYKNIKLKNLKKSINLLPMIKEWSNAEKQKLILILLEISSKSNLQFLRDCVKNK